VTSFQNITKYRQSQTVFEKVSKCFTNRSDVCIEMSLRDFRVTVRLGSEVVHAWVTIIKLSALETCRKAKGRQRVREVRGRVQVIVGDFHILLMRSLLKIFLLVGTKKDLPSCHLYSASEVFLGRKLVNLLRPHFPGCTGPFARDCWVTTNTTTITS